MIRDLSGIYIFMVNVNMLPLFSPGDFTCSTPPLKLISCLHIISPIPIPSLFFLAVLYSFPNSSNNLFMSYGKMPLPLSTICTLSISASLSQAGTIFTKPFFVNFSAFLTKLIKICFKRIVSPVRYLGKGYSLINNLPKSLNNL